MSISEVQTEFCLYWFVFCGIIMAGYFATASGCYWLLYSPQRQQSSSLKNNQKRLRTIAADIKLSVLSVVLFALGAASFMTCYNRGLTQVYTHWQIKDLGYILFSYGLVLLLQDTYFYFTHRLFHLPWLFQWTHHGHHQSRPPTPWTFFALDPMEAATQASFLFGITFILPLHLGVLVAVLVTMTVWSTGNHLGLQVVPFSRISRWWGHWCIGSAYHLVHHRRFTQHYGLYFTFWDRLLGTQSAKYETRRLRSASIPAE